MTARWIETDKGDAIGRELADRHYTRISVGHPMWTRPGWSQVLICQQALCAARRAVFVWWRPKWEAGTPGTARKDGLRAIECTIFRNETRYRSSDLILDALACLGSWIRARDVAWPDGVITGVSSAKTAGGRAKEHDPGWCFRAAGFEPFAHPGKNTRADVWLRYGATLPEARVPERTTRLIERRAA